MRHIVSKIMAVCGILWGMATVAAPFGDPDKGEVIFKKCISCHAVGPNARHKVGPQLNGIFGRKMGTADGYTRYSKGLIRAGRDGQIWDYDRLDAYLENPKSLVSDTRMNFRGIADENDRHHVIAYLRSFSDSPANIPEAAPTADAEEITLPANILSLIGDPEYGEYLGSECKTCHQENGADQGIPSITGWPERDFVIAMHAYKEKIRAHPVMQMMAGRLSNEEIAALAAYFAKK